MKMGGLKPSFLTSVLRVNGTSQLLDQAPAASGCTKQSQFWLPLSLQVVRGCFRKPVLAVLPQTPVIDLGSNWSYTKSKGKADNSMPKAKTKIRLFIAEIWSRFHLRGPR